MKKLFRSSLLLLLVGVICSFGVTANASEVTTEPERSDDSVVIVIMDGKSIAISENAMQQVLGKSDGPIRVMVKGKIDEGSIGVDIEALADGTLVAKVRKSTLGTAEQPVNIRTKTALPAYAGNSEESTTTRTTPNRYGWAKSWIECPVGIHNAKVKASMKYYDSGSTVNSGQDALLEASWNEVTWDLVNGPWGYWDPDGPNIAWINCYGEFDSWFPGNQHHTQMAEFDGLPGGYYYSYHDIDNLPEFHTFHTDSDLDYI
ncbi:MAG: hypothetical protein WC749_04740 [Dehalococcoidia bacterium]